MPGQFTGKNKKAIVEREQEIEAGDVWEPLIRFYFPALDPCSMSEEELMRAIMDVKYIENRQTAIMANAIAKAFGA